MKGGKRGRTALAKAGTATFAGKVCEQSALSADLLHDAEDKSIKHPGVDGQASAVTEDQERPRAHDNDDRMSSVCTGGEVRRVQTRRAPRVRTTVPSDTPGTSGAQARHQLIQPSVAHGKWQPGINSHVTMAQTAHLETSHTGRFHVSSNKPRKASRTDTELTMSSLLNALDGPTAAARIDSASCRPRLVEYHNQGRSPETELWSPVKLL